MDWKTMLFSTVGRIRRRDYWIWSIAAAIVYAVILVGAAIVTGTVGYLDSDEAPLPLFLIQLVLFGPSTWVSICITAKRWHDRGRSAWMYLILLVPVVGLIWTVIECGLMEGTNGPNDYGPSPKILKAAKAVA